jgi:hypothetical protein
MGLGWLFTAEGPIRYQRLEPSMIERFLGAGERVGRSGFFGGSVRIEAMRCTMCDSACSTAHRCNGGRKKISCGALRTSLRLPHAGQETPRAKEDQAQG